MEWLFLVLICPHIGETINAKIYHLSRCLALTAVSRE